MKTVFYVALLFMPLLLLSPVCLATKLEVITENWRPYNYLENGKVKGLSTVVVRKMLERAGLDYEIRVYPWARAYSMAQMKKNVLIYSMVKIAPRESKFKWIRPLGKGDTSSLYRLKSNTLAMPKNLQQAKTYDIVANINSMDHLWLKHNGFTKLQTPILLKQSIKMFFRQRVPLIAIDESSMSLEFASVGMDVEKVVKVMTLFKATPYLAASLDTDDALIQRLQTAYDELLKDGQIVLVN